MKVQRIQQPDWERRYADRNTPWDRGEPSPQLDAWRRSGHLAGGPVLVPGCGRGHEVVALCSMGLEVTAIDLSATALDALEESLRRAGVASRARLVQGDFLDFVPAQRFPVIYEQTSLCALSPELWPDYARRLGACLAPRGRLLALFMQTGRPGGPPWHCDPVAMQRLFPPPRWRWLESGSLIPHPSGPEELPVVLVSEET